MEEMPKKGLYLTMLILSILLGVLWGLLSIGPYTKMNQAITAGDSETAWANAKKIRTFFWIAVAINVVFILIRAFAG